MGGLNCNCATFCLRTHPLWNILKNSFFKKVLYLVVEYILNFSLESENFYFLENMLINTMSIVLQYIATYEDMCSLNDTKYTASLSVITVMLFPIIQ